MQQLKDHGRTILVASHDPFVYASPPADEVIVVRDGGIIQAPVGL
jgi:ABC-type lipoprotein export system ATPase subunit